MRIDFIALTILLTSSVRSHFVILFTFFSSSAVEICSVEYDELLGINTIIEGYEDGLLLSTKIIVQSDSLPLIVIC